MASFGGWNCNHNNSFIVSKYYRVWRTFTISNNSFTTISVNGSNISSNSLTKNCYVCIFNKEFNQNNFNPNNNYDGYIAHELLSFSSESNYSFSIKDLILPKGTYYLYYLVDSNESNQTQLKFSSSTTNIPSLNISTIQYYNITFNKNTTDEVLNMPSNDIKKHGVNYTIPSNIPTRAGYKFNGWGSSSTSTTAINNPGGTYTGNANYTYYAIWGDPIFTLTIDPNGGLMKNGSTANVSEPFSTQFFYGTKTYIGNTTNSGGYYPDNAPTRVGYTFVGFSFSPGGTGQLNTAGDRFYFNGGNSYANATSSYIFNGDYFGDVVATAQWTANTITIRYHPNKATYGSYTSKGTKIEFTPEQLSSVLELPTETLEYATNNSNGLHNIQNSNGLYLSRLGYQPVSGAQWYYLKSDGTKITINQTTKFSGKTFAEHIDSPKLIDSNNAEITVYANWEPIGVVKIYTDQGWKSTIPFIYTGSETNQGWKPSIPHIWDGTEWKTCK